MRRNTAGIKNDAGWGKSANLSTWMLKLCMDAVVPTDSAGAIHSVAALCANIYVYWQPEDSAPKKAKK